MMILVRMFAQAFQILRSNYNLLNLRILLLTYWHIIEHLASAFGCSAVYLPLLDVVEEVILVSVAAKALRSWSYRSAIISVSIPPRDIEPVLSCLSDIILELLELFLTHHLASICISDDANLTLPLSSSKIAYL
jgi:hypothetical protein